MPRKYTKEKLQSKIEEPFSNKNCNSLYRLGCINYGGKVKGEEITYQEVIAEYIYNKLIDNGLPYISLCNVRNYTKCERTDKSGEGEEKVQREYFNGKEMPAGHDLGKCIWFELPAIRNGCGKGVDLVYFNSENGQLSIIELKYESDESLLRPILEIQTYYQRIDWKKAIDDLKKRELINYNGKISIKKYIMFDKASEYIYKKYREIENDENSNLNKLLHAFDIGVIEY